MTPQTPLRNRYARRPRPAPPAAPQVQREAILACLERLEAINAGISGSAYADISDTIEALKRAVREAEGQR